MLNVPKVKKSAQSHKSLQSAQKCQYSKLQLSQQFTQVPQLFTGALWHLWHYREILRFHRLSEFLLVKYCKLKCDMANYSSPTSPPPTPNVSSLLHAKCHPHPGGRILLTSHLPPRSSVNTNSTNTSTSTNIINTSIF